LLCTAQPCTQSCQSLYHSLQRRAFFLHHPNSFYSATAKVDAASRKFFVGGNWKCNGSLGQAKELVSMLNQCSLTQNTEVVVCPAQVHLNLVKEGLRTDVAVGAQDVWAHGNGAYTGETSAAMLKDMGVAWTLVGHSERRGKGETDAETAAKAKSALDHGLSVIACCGEPLAHREAGTTNDFVFPQIRAYADAFDRKDWDRVVIAYERTSCAEYTCGPKPPRMRLVCALLAWFGLLRAE
jgi:glyceraldehyde 3-phosphate dehydrogenase